MQDVITTLIVQRIFAVVMEEIVKLVVLTMIVSQVLVNNQVVYVILLLAHQIQVVPQGSVKGINVKNVQKILTVMLTHVLNHLVFVWVIQ